MEDLLGAIAFAIAIVGLIFTLETQTNKSDEEYKIYNECYKIEDKYYCKN